MTSYKEIVTKAVIGKCKKTTKSSFEIQCDDAPNTVLGCWVINHTFSGTSNNGKVNLTGSYDVNVWYSYENDTKTAVCSKRFSYNDMMNVNLKNDAKLDSTSEIIVECLTQPTVVNVNIKNGLVHLEVEKELGVEVIGNTTVKVAVEDDFDDYEEEIANNELDINVDELNDDFIEDSVNN